MLQSLFKLYATRSIQGRFANANVATADMHFVLGPEVAENQFSYIFSEAAIPLRMIWLDGFNPKALIDTFGSIAGK